MGEGVEGLGGAVLQDATQLSQYDPFTKAELKAFDRVGTPEEMRSREHFFFEEERKDKLWPIPRELLLPKEDDENTLEVYELTEQGAVISKNAELGIGVAKNIGAKSIVNAGVSLAYGVKIGDSSVIGKNSTLMSGVLVGNNINMAQEVRVGPACRIEDSTFIGNGAVLWSSVYIGPFSSVGEGVWIGDKTKIYSSAEHRTYIGQSTKIGASNKIKEGAYVGVSVTTGERVSVGARSIIGADSVLKDGSGTMDNTALFIGAKLRNNTLAVRKHREDNRSGFRKLKRF